MRFLARAAAVSVALCGVACAQTSAPSASAPSKSAANSEAAKLLPYQDAKVPVEERITDLIGRMTLDEKLAMLGTDPTIPRLGIVGTNHVEGLHGLALGGPGGWGGRGLVTPTTQFPQSHGLGQTWDPELLRQAAAEEAYETRWAYNKYHKGGLVVRAPNADLSRDPRWGRTEESYGEDPFLVGTLATAYTEGLQGNDPKLWMTASLLKHFLANSNEDGRDGSSSNFDDRLFYEYYSVPFRMAIEDGHANAMMTSYNSWNKVPMGANPILHEGGDEGLGVRRDHLHGRGRAGQYGAGVAYVCDQCGGRGGGDPRGDQPISGERDCAGAGRADAGVDYRGGSGCEFARGVSRDDPAGDAGAGGERQVCADWVGRADEGRGRSVAVGEEQGAGAQGDG
jgi:hypothetical protein